jgi:hypothetical protein
MYPLCGIGRCLDLLNRFVQLFHLLLIDAGTFKIPVFDGNLSYLSAAERRESYLPIIEVLYHILQKMQLLFMTKS